MAVAQRAISPTGHRGEGLQEPPGEGARLQGAGEGSGGQSGGQGGQGSKGGQEAQRTTERHGSMPG